MIEDKEQLLNKQDQQAYSRTHSTSQNIKNTLPKRTRTRLIRRNRGTIKNNTKKRKRAEKVNKIVEECGLVSIAGQMKCNSTCISNENVQIQGFRRQRIQKIVFDISSFPQSLKQLYENKKKLKNTDLMRPGVKFVKNPSLQLIEKWEKALIVYQQNYKENQRCHFGLLIKYEKRIITFDGVMKLWPIKQVEKSFHWTMQPDPWSCGYRVLFWISQIQNIGLQRWIHQKEREVDWNKLPTYIEY